MSHRVRLPLDPGDEPGREAVNACLLVDADGLIQEAGGDLEHFHLSAGVAGASAAEVLPFLEGVLEAGAPPRLLPRVEVAPGTFADVHFSVVERGAWILLLDVTVEARETRHSQQRRYDEILRQTDDLDRDAGEALQALGVLVLREDGGGAHAVVSRPPNWARAWTDDSGPFVLLDSWPFLESFLPEAEAFCRARGDGVLRSGVWMETLPSGEEIALEATALRTASPHGLLVIERKRSRFRETRGLMQRAREHMLARESESREQEKKEVLLHCIVHDLRGPLTAMLGSLGLVRELPELSEQARLFCETGIRGGRRQQRLIQNVLEVYKADLDVLEGGALDDRCDASRVVRDIVEEYRPAFERKNVDLETTLGEGADAPIRADVGRLGRVIANLLDNALRHTPTGAWAALDVRGDGEALVIRVDNGGDPVPEDLREHLFEKFVRSQQIGGSSGLGLFSSRLAVERWGGSIQYEPLGTEGCRFEIRLPTNVLADARPVDDI